MATAKDILVKPISSQDARKICAAHHYSKSSVQNSQLHLGVFLDSKCHGVMSFGPSMDKSKIIGLVEGTKWNDFLELNRMAFGPSLPKNSESRALGVAFRMIKKNYPNIEWIVSFADGTQCGDGTIYRASGFLLTQIRPNKTLLKLPDGRIVTDLSLNISNPNQNASWWKKNGAVPLPGFQLRYLKPLNETVIKRLTCKIIPFSDIQKIGASMYKGQKRDGSKDNVASGFQSE